MELEEILKKYQEGSDDLTNPEGYDVRGALSGGLAALSAGFGGRDPLSAAMSMQGSREASKRADKSQKLSALDKWKQDQMALLESRRGAQDKERVMQAESVLNDPSSQESMIAQELARQMGYQGPITAAQFQRAAPMMKNVMDARMKQAELSQVALDKRERMGLDREKLQAELSKPKKDPFTETKMKKFAEQAVEWNTKDRGVFESNLRKVDHGLAVLGDSLRSGKQLFGPIKGQVPDAIRSLTNPEALIVRDAMHSAIQDTLRPTLGAQFTEKEGERIMNLAVNPKLSDAENYRRAKELQKTIERKLEATDALFAHIEENGTDRGFDYAKYGMRPVAESKKKESEKPAERVTVEEKDAALEWALQNSTDPKAKEIFKRLGITMQQTGGQ